MAPKSLVTRQCKDIIQVKWKTLTVLCSKFIQASKYQLLSELSKFRRRCDKNILAYFFLGNR